MGDEQGTSASSAAGSVYTDNCCLTLCGHRRNHKGGRPSTISRRTYHPKREASHELRHEQTHWWGKNVGQWGRTTRPAKPRQHAHKWKQTARPGWPAGTAASTGKEPSTTPGPLIDKLRATRGGGAAHWAPATPHKRNTTHSRLHCSRDRHARTRQCCQNTKGSRSPAQNNPYTT